MRVRLTAAVLVVLALLSATSCTRIRTRILMNEGNKLYKAQKYEEAIEKYQKILSLDSSDWGANYQVAMSYLALYHPGSTHAKDLEYADKSIAGFEKLLTLQAPDTETGEKIRNYYVALLRSAEKTEKVIAYYNSLLAKNPKDPVLLGQLAEIYAKKGDVPNALKYYDMRAQAEPNNKEGWYTIGVVCWEHVHNMGPTMSDEEREALIEKGRQALEKALSMDKDYFDALVYMGLLFREKASALSAQMKNEEAGEAFNTAEEYRHRAEEIGKKRMAAQAAKKGA